MDPINPLVRRVVAEARDDPDAFWRKASQDLYWARTPERIFEADPPTFRWFGGGQTNIAYAAVDRNVELGRGGQTALICLREDGQRRSLTYAALHHEVRRTAAALRALGVERGDRVTLYMPTCAEAIVAMLAVLRVGAVHSVVFAGFGSGALADRVAASGSRLVLTADVTMRKGREVDLAAIVRDAVDVADSPVERIVMLQRSGAEAGRPAWQDPRLIDWQAFLDGGQGADDGPVWLESNEPAFILATSGTTAKPKLAVHTHGGYGVYITAQGRWCFGLQPDDVWWCTSDIGWVVGHSYIVYAPLMRGATTLAFEGAIDHPDASSPWRLMAEFGVTGVFTSPTAVRLLMRYGTDATTGHQLGSLKRVFCAGETLNAPAWEWLQREVLRDRVPVIDHMWQTETGGPVFGNPYGIAMVPIKPGSAGIPLPGVECEVVDAAGQPLAATEKGIMVIKRPFPGLIASLWGEPDRYAKDYWSRVPGRYWTGDSAHIDEDGYVWFAGRADEIIKIAGHRLGTIEAETALLKHPAVAEAGVTGQPDELRGETIAAFVVLRQGHAPSATLREELLATARRELGPVAVIGRLEFVANLPKTRSGKIMRRVLKAVVQGRDPGDVTTIEDEASVEEAREAWASMRDEASGR
ncbi:MAG: acetate--CoA ligase [Candidatus Limnocylindrales bacterium]